MKSFDILAIHGFATFLELKNVCQVISSCKYCSVLYTPYLYSTKCIYNWIDAAESWQFLDDRSIVALVQTSVTVKDILHIVLRSRKSDFELAHVELERIPHWQISSSDDESSSSEYYGREFFTLISRFNRTAVRQ